MLPPSHFNLVFLINKSYQTGLTDSIWIQFSFTHLRPDIASAMPDASTDVVYLGARPIGSTVQVDQWIDGVRAGGPALTVDLEMMDEEEAVGNGVNGGRRPRALRG